ncbi:ABC transporter permease [Thermogladius sp. 4427co]|uniref:ABC transporter permease n=1 Tax=Thermogladius sp. 4427co TaxID=3450718 RepID=UPI003F7AB477
MLRLTDIIRLSMKTLSEKKVRAILTIIGIAIGPLAITMIYGVTSSYSDYIVSQIQGLGQNLIVVTPSQGYQLSDRDLNRIREIPHVVSAAPFYSTQGYYGGKTSNTVFVYAVDPDFLTKAISSLQILKGVAPSPNDASKCILGYDIAFDESGREVYDIGDVVSVSVFVSTSSGVSERRLNVMVSAIFAKYGGALFLNPDKSVFVPFSAAKLLLGVSNWTGILVLADSPENVDSIVGSINDMYGNNVNVVSFIGIARIASSITSAVNFMTFAASLSAFAVAVAGVASTMITSVMERTREIGVMKALGFTDLQIVILTLSEGIIMSLIGGFVGIILGVIGAHILASKGLVISSGFFNIVIRTSPKITIGLIAEVVLLTVLTGITGSILPAYRAAKIPPAEALRYE